MPPSTREDGGSPIAQLVTNYSPTTASADIISQDITIRINYISSITDLQTAQELRITSHEPSPSQTSK
ncbi:hypothetical protein FPOAC1_003774 [Fusarium poae]|uniref:hypothetical protein n=1 Tax=Fusarium poae TaxID=36050 RepID=UPI001CE8B473|nr:hypothetical protein FPOAC1_003774 [Fusarium poae]KAG8677746.1 hypothetical protein FPOAC1_003774 [Fusarium poae]